MRRTLRVPPETSLTWAICAAATAGVIARPFRLPEAVWAVAGAVASGVPDNGLVQNIGVSRLVRPSNPRVRS